MYTDYTPKHKQITNGIPMYSCQGKHIGDVIGNEWRKEVVNAWMLTTPPALAVDVQTLHDAIRAGAEYVVIRNTDSGIIYRASIAKMLDKGWEFNRGFGLQRGLVLSQWMQERDPNFIPPKSEPPTDPTPTAPDVKELKYKSRAVKGAIFNGKQLSLFSEVK